MPILSDKQLQQVSNILQTLIEATEHFHKLIKVKELNQSIFIFSSIVEGFGAVNNIHTRSDNTEWAVQKNKQEELLLEISRMLEKGNFIKINEILQFSFLPLLRKMSLRIAREIGNHNPDKMYTIGVFHSLRNPREFITADRLNALIQESERQNTKLLFFTSSDVDFDKNEITADLCMNEKWERIKAPFPDVINNVGTGKRSPIERKLRRILPFTSFHVGNKFTLPKRIMQNRKYAELLVPFKTCHKIEDIHEFIVQNKKVVFKSVLGNRGENIYFITRKGSRYVLLEQKKERILNYETFNKWVQTVILREKGSFIVQRYIHTRTNKDEPYHIRSQVQKDGEGKWVVTHIYASIGNKKGNLSNLSAGGRNEDLQPFSQREFGEKRGDEFESILLKLSIGVAMHLDKLYGLVLNELGLDFASDETGRIWMHEANNGPQTGFFEEKRAVYTIAYAKYIAKNGIVHSDSTRKAESGFFQSRTTKLAIAELDKRPTIGVLRGKIGNDPLAIACTEVAKEKNINLYFFTPKDVDYDEMLIKGYFYENDEWVPKVVEYPDVIFDRLKLRGNKDAQWIYEEFVEIPFTNEWASILHSRSEIYSKIQEADDSDLILSNFQKVTKTRDIFRYIENYGKVLLKPANESTGTYDIKILPNRKYAVTNGNAVKEYNELPLLNKLKRMIKEKNFIVQKDTSSLDKNGQAFSIHAHLILNKDKEWSFVSVYSQKTADSTDNTAKKHLKEELVEFLLNNYGEEDAKILGNKIEAASKIEATKLQNIYGEVISEVAIILGIDNDQQLNLIDIDPNGPSAIYDANIHAKKMIDYADYLISLNESAIQQN